jgi:hypothetical protein
LHTYTVLLSSDYHNWTDEVHFAVTKELTHTVLETPRSSLRCATAANRTDSDFRFLGGPM